MYHILDRSVQIFVVLQGVQLVFSACFHKYKHPVTQSDANLTLKLTVFIFSYAVMITLN